MLQSRHERPTQLKAHRQPRASLVCAVSGLSSSLAGDQAWEYADRLLCRRRDEDGDGNGGEVKASASMDCPLCASVAAPPSRLTALFTKPSALEHALHPIAAAHIAALTAPPLPSRDPPAAS